MEFRSELKHYLIMSEVKTPPEVVLVVLLEAELGALEVDEDGGEEIVVHVVAAAVLLQQQRDGAAAQQLHEGVYLHLADGEELLLRGRVRVRQQLSDRSRLGAHGRGHL